MSNSLVLGSIKSKTYLKTLDWLAKKADKVYKETGEITGIIVDNYSMHRSREVREKEGEWQAQVLYIFFLPSYSPELNLIEPEWGKIKGQELAGRSFEDEYELAQAVIACIEERSLRCGYRCERFKFNSP